MSTETRILMHQPQRYHKDGNAYFHIHREGVRQALCIFMWGPFDLLITLETMEARLKPLIKNLAASFCDKSGRGLRRDITGKMGNKVTFNQYQ